MSGFVAKTLKPIFRSQPAPEKVVEEGLTTIVGTTYRDIVYNNDKDVFVKYYATWCGHCKSLAPKYDEVAKAFEKDANVIIAKMDAAENDLDEQQFEVTGFPTLYFFKAGSKDAAIRYNGERTAEGITEFINKNRGTAAAADATKDEL